MQKLLAIPIPTVSARFTYWLDRLKPRVSKFRGPPVKVYNIFNTVIGLSHLCCHNVLYFLNNPSVVFLTTLQLSEKADDISTLRNWASWKFFSVYIHVQWAVPDLDKERP